MQIKIAIVVLVLLLCLRRRRTGDERQESQPDATDIEQARAADEAFVQFNNPEIP